MKAEVKSAVAGNKAKKKVTAFVVRSLRGISPVD